MTFRCDEGYDKEDFAKFKRGGMVEKREIKRYDRTSI